MVTGIFGRVTSQYLVLFLLLFSNSIAFAQKQVSGRITDLSRKGVEGVIVSDGYNVYKSDSRGNFAFESHPGAKFVFISTPGGYEQESSFFYRLDSGLPSSITFILRKVGKQSDSFVHIGDSEASTYKNWIDGLKEYISNHKLAFLLMNGDICYEKGLDFHFREINDKTMRLRVVYTLGNHDLIAGDYGEQHFERLFGPVWYSFNVGRVHFINTPVIYGDKVPGYTADDIYNWLKKDLEALPAGTPVILFNHHLYGYSEDFLMKTDKQSLDLGAFNLKGYLYAHYHTNLFSRTAKGVSTFSSMSPNKGGIDHSPSSFRVLYFNDEGELKSALKYSFMENHVVANAFKVKNGYSVTANIYDTGSETESAVILLGSSEFKLKKCSSWVWDALLPEVAGERVERGEILKVKVKFSDGSVTVKPVITNHNRKIEWVKNMGGNTFMVSPIVAGELVISATANDDSGKGTVNAFDRFSGERRWSFGTRNSVKGGMALWNGIVLACDVEGRLYGIDVSSGKLLWERALREKNIHPVFTQGVTVNNGIAYTGQGSALSAVRVSDGELLWVNSAWKGGVSTVASPVIDPNTGILLSGGYWLGRFANDGVSGKLIWEKRDNDSRICDNTPVAFGGKFYYTSPGYITEVDPLTGEESQKVRINYSVNVTSRPIVTDKYYIVGTADKGIVAFDRQEGYREMWNYRTNPALIYTAPYTKDFQMTVESGACLIGNDLYFGANDGFLYCLDVRNGLFRWRLNMGAPILGNIVAGKDLTGVKDVLYVNDFGGNLWCISLSDDI